MDVLLRRVTIRPDGREEYQDTEVSAVSLFFGSAPDQTLQLVGGAVGREHGEISGAAGSLRLSARRGQAVTVNGAPAKTQSIEVGDRIEIGGHTLVVIAAPAGFDLALEIHPDPDASSADFEGAFQTGLDATWLAKRAPAWLFGVAVIVLALLVPMLVNEIEDARPPAALSDAMWLSGPLLPAHQVAIGDDCRACHQRYFEKVPDDGCTVCHDQVADHAAAHLNQLVGLTDTRCATCHREHNEPGHIVVDADALCVDCHMHPRQDMDLDGVAGFGAVDHPEFEVRLVKSTPNDVGTGVEFRWDHHLQSIGDAQETSNLKYPHDLHLDPGKVTKLDVGSALACRDCHRLTADNEHFESINMERHCAACHDLRFDLSEPDRALPHGDPAQVLLAMDGHFMRKFGNPDARPRERSRRRRPDRAGTSSACTGPAFECAQQALADEARRQFTQRGCVTCHEVTSDDEATLYERYRVLPVRLVADFMPTARFDHRAHLTQASVSGDEACKSCHAADTSGTAADVLIPAIDNCVRCHDDHRTADKIALHCVACHDFHLPQAMRMNETL